MASAFGDIGELAQHQPAPADLPDHPRPLHGKDRPGANRRNNPISVAQSPFHRRHRIGDNLCTRKGQPRAQPFARTCRIGPGEAKTGLQPGHRNIAAQLRKRHVAGGQNVAKGSFGCRSDIGRPGFADAHEPAVHIRRASNNQVHANGTLTASGDEGLGLWSVLASSLPLLALVVGLLTIQAVKDDHIAVEIAATDSALLTDELPPHAYTDAGFAQFLKIKHSASEQHD